MPEIAPKNGKRVACIGGGPASLTVARDLAPLGYHVVVYDRDAAGGGMMRSQIPAFRLPESVLNEEVERILDFGLETRLTRKLQVSKRFLTKTSTLFLLVLVRLEGVTSIFLEEKT